MISVGLFVKSMTSVTLSSGYVLSDNFSGMSSLE
jgi:hypothetical protein